MLGLRASEQEEGGEDVEDAVEIGGLWRKSISQDLAQSDDSGITMGLAIARSLREKERKKWQAGQAFTNCMKMWENEGER